MHGEKVLKLRWLKELLGSQWNMTGIDPAVVRKGLADDGKGKRTAGNVSK